MVPGRNHAGGGYDALGPLPSLRHNPPSKAAFLEAVVQALRSDTYFLQRQLPGGQGAGDAAWPMATALALLSIKSCARGSLPDTGPRVALPS
jgi:hypothetical protein